MTDTKPGPSALPTEMAGEITLIYEGGEAQKILNALALSPVPVFARCDGKRYRFHAYEMFEGGRYRFHLVAAPKDAGPLVIVGSLDALQRMPRDYRTAAARHLDPAAWQAIATAPLDGSDVIIRTRWPTGHFSRAEVASWCDTREGWIGEDFDPEGRNEYLGTGRSDGLLSPTEWQPMPQLRG